MEAKRFLLLALFSSVLPFSGSSSATVVTFDDIPTGTGTVFPIPTGVQIPSGYQGLDWAAFYVANGILNSNFWGVSGYTYGVVSPSNVAFDVAGGAAWVQSDTNFDFFSAYLTGALRSNLSIEVYGINASNVVVYDETKVVSATAPTLCTFNYMDINTVLFSPSGGQPAHFPGWGDGEQFAMDNFTFEFIPEPSSLLLTTLGVLTLWAFRKRRTS